MQSSDENLLTFILTSVWYGSGWSKGVSFAAWLDSHSGAPPIRLACTMNPHKTHAPSNIQPYKLPQAINSELLEDVLFLPDFLSPKPILNLIFRQGLEPIRDADSVVTATTVNHLSHPNARIFKKGLTMKAAWDVLHVFTLRPLQNPSSCTSTLNPAPIADDAEASEG